MNVRFIYSVCEWHENDKWTDQLDLIIGGVQLERTLRDVRDKVQRLTDLFDDEQLVVVVDLLHDDGPRVESTYGYIPGKYLDRSDVLERRLAAVKDKLVSYVIHASLSEALKPE